MRPRFLDQPYFQQRTKRTDESMIDYATPIWRAPSTLSWLWSDIVIGLMFIVVLVGLLWGVL